MRLQWCPRRHPLIEQLIDRGGTGSAVTQFAGNKPGPCNKPKIAIDYREIAHAGSIFLGPAAGTSPCAVVVAEMPRTKVAEGEPMDLSSLGQ